MLCRKRIEGKKSNLSESDEIQSRSTSRQGKAAEMTPLAEKIGMAKGDKAERQISQSDGAALDCCKWSQVVQFE
jgi:hypothetical protein